MSPGISINCRYFVRLSPLRVSSSRCIQPELCCVLVPVIIMPPLPSNKIYSTPVFINPTRLLHGNLIKSLCQHTMFCPSDGSLCPLLAAIRAQARRSGHLLPPFSRMHTHLKVADISLYAPKIGILSFCVIKHSGAFVKSHYRKRVFIKSFSYFGISLEQLPSPPLLLIKPTSL